MQALGQKPNQSPAPQDRGKGCEEKGEALELRPASYSLFFLATASARTAAVTLATWTISSCVPEVVAHACPGMAPHSGHTKLIGLMGKIGVCLMGSFFFTQESSRPSGLPSSRQLTSSVWLGRCPYLHASVGCVEVRHYESPGFVPVEPRHSYL